jgi:hypothetical protein
MADAISSEKKKRTVSMSHAVPWWFINRLTVAYNLARTESFYTSKGTAGHGSNSNENNQSKEWKSLWSIKCPGKMKIVLWRMAHDCLPTTVQLQRQHIPTKDECVFCSRSEPVEHLMLFCPYARAVWEYVKVHTPMKLCKFSFRDMKQWLVEFLSNANDIRATVLAVTCWHLWDARSGACNDRGQLHPSQVACKVNVYTDNIVLHCYKTKSGNMCDSSISPRWIPPPPGKVCVNVDDEVLTRQCLCLGLLIHGAYVGAWRI